MIKVTDQKTPNVESDSILIQEKYDAIPTPNGQLKSGVYYSWKGKWNDMWDKFISRAQALIDLNLSDYVPKTRTITINGDTKDLSADGSWAVSGGLVQSVSDTKTVDLTVDGLGDLTANVRHQDTATINLSEDASGLKADFASMNISQFTNDSGYTTNTGTVTSVAALTLGTTGTDLSSTVANSTTTPVITLNVPTASASNRGALSSTDWSTFNNKIGGSGTTNEIAYFSGSSTLSSLSTATYPSLTELSYVKGVTSAVQTQLDAKQDLILKASLSAGNVTLTNTLTATDLTGLSFSVAANTRYYIFGQIDCGSANASGIKWAINAPTATTLDVNFFGLTSAATAFRSEMITALTTLTTNGIPAANTTQGFVYLSGTIETGANSGTVQIQWATVANYTITAYKLGTGLFLIKL